MPKKKKRAQALAKSTEKGARASRTLTFKVSANVHQDMKMASALSGKPMTTIFLEGFDLWKRSGGLGGVV
jgi:hypothetical protein